MNKAAPETILSHWNTLLENFALSPQQFFERLEEGVRRREAPDTTMGRVDWKEGGLLSAKREYLRVKRKEHTFDICAAPFGNSFFVSWWLGSLPSGWMLFLSGIPLMGWLVERFVKPLTYYQIDTALMFQTLVHSAVLEVIDECTNTQGLRRLTELERKPVLRDFFER